ncbi:MAG TPA: prolyl oligopeptidase family serine peptidase [Acidisarcina sp.]
MSYPRPVMLRAKSNTYATALLVLCLLASTPAHARHVQETGFLNRQITLGATTWKYQVYLPEDYSSHQHFPVILFLHGSGERGTDGLEQTQIGLPAAIRAHPERWPFLVVMPQIPYHHRHWTDPDIMAVAIAALDATIREFKGDPQRVYLTGISLGGYGAWEVARTYPHRFAAVVPVCGGIYWSYAPERRAEPDLPEQYAHALGRTPVWMFHGLDDPVVSPKQSETMYDAIRAARGDVRLWEFAGVQHAVWDKAYAEPELPRWLLAHHLGGVPTSPVYAEKTIIPFHPAPAKVNPEIYNAYVGEYTDDGLPHVTIYRQGDQLFARNNLGQINELLPESPTTFFYSNGGPSRLTFQKSPSGAVKSILYSDDRHEETWDRHR